MCISDTFVMRDSQLFGKYWCIHLVCLNVQMFNCLKVQTCYERLNAVEMMDASDDPTASNGVTHTHHRSDQRDCTNCTNCTNCTDLRIAEIAQVSQISDRGDLPLLKMWMYSGVKVGVNYNFLTSDIFLPFPHPT